MWPSGKVIKTEEDCNPKKGDIQILRRDACFAVKNIYIWPITIHGWVKNGLHYEIKL